MLIFFFELNMFACIHWSYTFFFFSIRSVKTSNTDVLRLLLDALRETNQLTDALLDHCLLLARPNEFEEMSTVTTYCLVVSYLHDVSYIRALVEKYTDVLENDSKVKKQTNRKNH